MNLMQFEMMKGVEEGNHYVVIAKNEKTTIGVMPWSGSIQMGEEPYVYAGFKLRIEGERPMIPSYRGHGGDHYSSYFIAPVLKLPAAGFMLPDVVGDKVEEWLEALAKELSLRGIPSMTYLPLMKDYVVEVFRNTHPPITPKPVNDPPAFFNPKKDHPDD